MTTGIVAISTSGTLYAAVPCADSVPAKFRIRRCQLPGREAGPPQERELVGILASVRLCERFSFQEEMVVCGHRAFGIVEGTLNKPIAGHRMAAGGDRQHVQEVTSPILSTRVIPTGREWVVDPLVRAFRNCDPKWASLLRRQDWETEEAPEDLEQFYGQWSAHLGSPIGPGSDDGGPREWPIRTVKTSRRSFGKTLREVAVGGLEPATLPLSGTRKRSRTDLIRALNEMLGWLKWLRKPAPGLAVAVAA